MAGQTPSPGAAGKPGKKARRPQRPRHVPQRTCVACRQVRPKRELLRIVRTPQGRVELDATGKKPGRGTYLCARRSCWDLALKKGRLEHEFELTLMPEDRLALEAYAETLPVETAAPPLAAARRKKPAPSA
jgi:predicted RNA-binding protein YlxR (DUF448 family)